jgi:sugar lactone lactonase YvrE
MIFKRMCTMRVIQKYISVFCVCLSAASWASPSDWVISTVAGTPENSRENHGGSGAFSGDDGAARLAQLNRPEDVAFDGLGNLYIADTWNHRIRKIDRAGIINTVAGNGEAGFSGDGGLATQAQLSHPSGIAVSDDGVLYIADTRNRRIRRVDTQGIISTVVGTGEYGETGDGFAATDATLQAPYDVRHQCATSVIYCR